MEWTTEHMPMPTSKHPHDGTWGCNGEYHWRALSNGKDRHARKYPNIDQRKRKWNAITGSNSLYSFHAGPGENLARIHEMHVRFVPCYCELCRTDVSSNDCANLGCAGSPWYVALHEVAGRAPLRRTRATTADAASSGSAGLPSACAIPKMQVTQLRNILQGRGLETHGLKPELVKRLQDYVATFRPAAADEGTEQRPAEQRRVLPQRKAKKRARIARDEDSDDKSDDNSDGDSDHDSDHDSAVGADGDSDNKSGCRAVDDVSDNEVWLPSRLSTLGFE